MLNKVIRDIVIVNGYFFLNLLLNILKVYFFRIFLILFFNGNSEKMNLLRFYFFFIRLFRKMIMIIFV